MQGSVFADDGTPKLLTQQQKRKDGKYYKAMRYVLYVLFGGVEGLAFDRDMSLYCDDDEHKKLYDYYRSNADGDISLEDLAELEKEIPEAGEVLAEGRKVNDRTAKGYFDDCVRTLENEFVKKQRKMLLKAYSESDSEEEKSRLLAQISAIQKKK